MRNAEDFEWGNKLHLKIEILHFWKSSPEFKNFALIWRIFG